MSIFPSVVRHDTRPQQSIPQRRDDSRTRRRSAARNRRPLTLACSEALEPRRLLAVTVVSSNVTNTGSANAGSDPLYGPFISTTGRFVAFESAATDVVSGVTGGQQQVYLRDRIAGTTQLVSRDLFNAPANGTSWLADMTPDGRFIVFFTTADLTSSNLDQGRVPLDNNNDIDLYLRDMATGSTFLISGSDAGGLPNPTGGQTPLRYIAAGVANDGTRPTLPAYISNDGRYVSFVSPANGLADQSDMKQNPTAGTDVNGVNDIFVRDRQLNLTLLVTEGITQGRSPEGAEIGTDGIVEYDMSDDAAVIAYITDSQMVSGDTNGLTDVYRRTVFEGDTNRSSTSAPVVFDVAISGNGEIIAFQHDNPGFVPAHIDIAVGPGPNSPFTPLEPNSTFGPLAITPDARYIVFRTAQTDLIDQPTSGVNVFRYDRTTGMIELVSLGNTGGTTALLGNARAGRLSVTPDGRFITYDSDGSGSDLAISNYGAPGQRNVYARDMNGTSVTLLNVRWNDATSAASGDAYQPVISADGKVAAFISTAPDLISNDLNGGLPDVFSADVFFIPQPPFQAFLNAPNVTTGGATSYTFTVTYFGPRPVVLSSIDSNDVFVQRFLFPGFITLAAELVSVNSTVNATALTATYRIVPPGGSWDVSDNGTYEVMLRNRQVADIQGNQLLAQSLGTFQVNIPITENVAPVFNASVSEAAGTYSLNVPLAAGSSVVPGNTVDYAVISGTAVFDQDFRLSLTTTPILLQSGTITLQPDGTFNPIIFDIIQDAFVEGNESFQVVFSNATPGLLLAFQRAVITILDDDSDGSGTVIVPGAINPDLTPGISPGSTISLNNGVPTITAPENIGDIVVPLSRAGTNTTGSTVTFSYIVYSVPSDTAVAGQNFLFDTGTVTFAAGSDVPTSVSSQVFGTTDQLRVRLLHDGLVTGDRTFTVVLTNATTGLIIGGTSIQVIVLDIDSAVLFPTTSLNVTDDEGIIEIPITRIGNTATFSNVTFSVAGSSAQLGQDFEFVDESNPLNPNPVITFAPGETTKVLRIRTLSRPFSAGSFREILLTITPQGTQALTPGFATAPGVPSTMTVRINNVDATPPQVESVDFRTSGNRVTSILVRFNEAVLGSAARKPNNYALFPRTGNKLGRIIRFASAKYNPATSTVTLVPGSPLPASGTYQLNINGRGTIVDLAGNRIDGDGDGRPGGSAIAVFGAGKSISYTDRDRDIVSFRVSGPGTLKFVNLNNGVTLEVLNADGDNSELLGSVARRKGGDGRAELDLIRLNGATFDPSNKFTGDIEALSASLKKRRK